MRPPRPVFPTFALGFLVNAAEDAAREVKSLAETVQAVTEMRTRTCT